MRPRRSVARIVVLTFVALLVAPAGAHALSTTEPDEGRELYVRDCISCHGPDGSGVAIGSAISGPEQTLAGGPSLHGVGAASAHLYLTTGYMPLGDADDQPRRSEPTYTDEQIETLVEYVSSFPGGGPPIPEVHPEGGDVAEGLRAFTTYCAGCHQLLGEGGVAGGGALAPQLAQSTAVQVAEAIRVGPHVMPRFSEELLEPETVDSIAAYVLYAQEPRDDGGWALGHLGPVAEGLLAWAVAGIALVLLARALGKKAR